MTAPRLPLAWLRFAPLPYAVALLALLLWLGRDSPLHNGDVAEYTATTAAFANHGTPDIRPADLREVQQALPAFAIVFGSLEQDYARGGPAVSLPFARGRDGKVYCAHFFAYSALAAVPYRLLPALGVDRLKCYQVVNLCFVLVLGLSLRRLAGGDNLKAAAALALVLTAGSWPYLRWTSPEVMSAAALLSALALFCTGAPLRAGVLAAAGALQNPSIALALGAMPLLRLAIVHRGGQPWRAQLAEALGGWRGAAGLALGTALALLAPLWNWLQFGVPSLIASVYTRAEYASLVRLHSLFFDLSQGMIVGMPALAVLLLGWAWRRQPSVPEARRLLVACVLTTALLALPALPVINWNSGAQGMMRYAVWAAMPLLFALLWQLRGRRGWLAPVAVALLLQVLTTRALERYTYVQFSPLAQRVLEHAPAWYNPEPEIFAERSKHSDDYFEPPAVYTYRYHGQPAKTLYHAATPASERALCGPNAELAPDNDYADTTRGWRYINGAVKCRPRPAAR